MVRLVVLNACMTAGCCNEESSLLLQTALGRPYGTGSPIYGTVYTTPGHPYGTGSPIPHRVTRHMAMGLPDGTD